MPARTTAALSLASGLALALSACSDHFRPYLERSDTLAPYAGEAARANAAIHAIDPWPPGSANTTLTYDGTRAARAVERYQTRPLDGEVAERTPAVVQFPMAR